MNAALSPTVSYRVVGLRRMVPMVELTDIA